VNGASSSRKQRLQVTFLGTGTSHGVPMIGCDCTTCRSDDPRDRRLRPSIYIQADTGERLLVDAGPDLRMQALVHDIRHIDAILFTHGHADHILGLDDVRRFNALMNRPMPLYGDQVTLQEIRRTFSYVFDADTPKGGGLPQLELIPIAGPFRIGAQAVAPVPIWHGQRPILGLRIGRLAYLTDCSRIPDSSLPLLEGLDVLVIGALRERPHPTHFSVAEALEAADRIRPRRTLFTHMCHDLPHAATCARLPEGVTLAYDGLSISVEDR
jgi:phosphoribosyl 1,2-cyclic phosphate phosphodiesterase